VGCVGMCSIDTALFVTNPSTDDQSVHLVDDVTVSLGGKGLIAAVAMSHEGVDIAPLALVGRNSRIAASISDTDTISTNWLIPAQAEDSQIWLTIGDAHRVAAFVATGRGSLSDAELDALGHEYAASVDALYLSFEVLPLLRGAFTSATRHRKPVAVNLSRPLIDSLVAKDRNFFRSLVTKANLILCNADESKRALRALTAQGWADVASPNTSLIITEGDAGGSVYTPSDSEWKRYKPVKASIVKSVVGAGDTFNGALLAAHWAKGLPIIESCEPAATLASMCLGLPSSSILGTL
jgi:sugar/nucleoside kinase (ribokinase family)